MPLHLQLPKQAPITIPDQDIPNLLKQLINQLNPQQILLLKAALKCESSTPTPNPFAQLTTLLSPTTPTTTTPTAPTTAIIESDFSQEQVELEINKMVHRRRSDTPTATQPNTKPNTKPPTYNINNPDPNFKPDPTSPIHPDLQQYGMEIYGETYRRSVELYKELQAQESQPQPDQYKNIN